MCSEFIYERWGVKYERWGVKYERWGVKYERWGVKYEVAVDNLIFIYYT
jgi:hypothetical protein